MYYSFYLNERMLLDNWKYYDDCNWLLMVTLAKDWNMAIEDKRKFYLDNRHEKSSFLKQLHYSEDFQEAAFMYDVYEGQISKNETLERYKYLNSYSQSSELDQLFTQMTKRSMNLNKTLREVTEVVLYKSDFEYIERMKREYSFTVKQVKAIFGLIFFSRMWNSKWCRVGTPFKLQQFESCFPFSVDDVDIVYAYVNAFDSLETKKDKSKYNIYAINYMRIEDELDYIYPNFDNKDEIAYVFKTTLENNKLDLDTLAEEIIPNLKNKYCDICGKEFTPKSNRQKHCIKCGITKKKQDAAERKRKQREKEKSDYLIEKSEECDAKKD